MIFTNIYLLLKLTLIDGNLPNNINPKNKMEIVSKIAEPKLVWEIFTFVAESPLTKEKKKLQKEIEKEYSNSSPKKWGIKFEEYFTECFIPTQIGILEQITSVFYEERKERPISVILKVFENQEYDHQRTSNEIDEGLGN